MMLHLFLLTRWMETLRVFSLQIAPEANKSDVKLLNEADQAWHVYLAFRG